MLTFNKLAGSTIFKGCPGSCKEHSAGCWNPNNWKKSPCYVAKSYTQYKDVVINCHIFNTLGMRNSPFAVAVILDNKLSRMRSIKPIRIHSSGELESVQELKAWLWLAKKHPKNKFYIYTKAYDILEEILEKEKKVLPPNFFINISIWHEAGIKYYLKWKNLTNIRAFVYDDGGYDYAKHGLTVKTYCPAYKKNEKGKVKLSHDLTCDKCTLCFQPKQKVIGCLSH